MKIAVLIHIRSNDYEKIHSLMLSVFSQCHLKKEIFVSVSDECVSPDVHKLLTGTRDQSVVKIHQISTVKSLGGKSTDFTERNRLLQVALKSGFDGFAFAEVGTIWKPGKIKACVDKLSMFRIEHYYTRPKLCITDFGFYNLEYARRVAYYCGEIRFEPNTYLKLVTMGTFSPYPLPAGNLVFDRVAALHAINQGVHIPLPYEQWILFACSLGKSNFYVLPEAWFEADWTHFGSQFNSITRFMDSKKERTRAEKFRMLLEAKRKQLEEKGLRKKTNPIEQRSAWAQLIHSVLGRNSGVKVLCRKRAKRCIQYLNGHAF